MASESTTTPTRRPALQDLSVNVVHKTTPSAARRLGAIPAYPSKPAILAEEPRVGESNPRAEPHAVRGEARLGGQKRVFGLVQDVVRRDAEARGLEEADHVEGGEAARKRVKTVGEVAVDNGQPDEGERSDNEGVRLSVYEEDTSSSGLSPGSSLGCSFHGLNDTMVTEPDDPRPGVMSREEVRQKARALRLRLSLAKYKVQTNQIDTPISRLEIKRPSQSLELPSIPRFANTPQNRPFSSAGHSDTQLNLSQVPNLQHTRSFSSPQPYIEITPFDESREEPKETVSTPLLPRQRHSLLYPPLLGAEFEDRSPARELTSSVVKGRAAKGLLSLMGHES